MLKHFGKTLQSGHGLFGMRQKSKTVLMDRSFYKVVGPPAYKMTFGQKLLLGGGSAALMMVIPVWALFSLPSWQEKSKRVGSGKKTEVASEDANEENAEEKK